MCQVEVHHEVEQPHPSEHEQRIGRLQTRAVWELNWVATDTRIREEPSPPANTGSHDFDFEIGSWKVANSRLLDPLTDSARWIHFEGTSVARKVWNGRAVLLELASEPPSGPSEGLILRTYDPRRTSGT